ncbi:hypothetical protein OSB04_006651 [Centaurea solstitialis]|uniref:Helitron helicase-like domain-containing protein n=1 Tax=Centaurea solstitialis TaxID=347529 RepID=A0AA38TTW2_9ASTR|nr:hypothetical protein OSB04_006651 [Centaurea solstitialis]
MPGLRFSDLGTKPRRMSIWGSSGGSRREHRASRCESWLKYFVPRSLKLREREGVAVPPGRIKGRAWLEAPVLMKSTPNECLVKNTQISNEFPRRTSTYSSVTQRGADNSPSTRHTSAYLDLGDCDKGCEYCNAYFWYTERLKGGRVKLQTPCDPPMLIKNLFTVNRFMENIHAYNQMFAMTSFGAKVDDSINNGSGPFVFKVEGQISYWIGCLCPLDDDNPRFLQMYIYDTDNEIENRLRHFTKDKCQQLEPEIVEQLLQLLDAHNELVKLFRKARDICLHEEVPQFYIRLYNKGNRLCYNSLVVGTLGAIIYDDGPKTKNDFDIIIHLKDSFPQRINKLHPSYMALQFPL